MSVCVDAIKAVGDGDISDREAGELLRLLAKRARDIQRTKAGVSSADALNMAGSEFKRNAEMVATVRKRNAYLGRMKKLQGLNMIRTHFAGDYERGLKSLTVGTQGGEVGSRMSAALEIDQIRKFYEAGFIADVNRIEGGIELIHAGEMGREVSNVLFDLNTPGKAMEGHDPRAVALGRVMHKWQEVARTEANRAGAWIGKLDGYIVTQSHDAHRISKDRDGWMTEMNVRADLSRMMDETEAESIEDLLRSLYNGLSTGVHMKTMPGNGEPAKGLKGMARGLSHDRVIHFKSADDWYAYNEKFGAGSVYDAAFMGLKNTARATGIMRVLGPNHEATFDGIVADLTADMQRKADPKTAAFTSDSKRIKEWYLHQIDGTNTVVGNDIVSTVLRNTRVVQTMSSLGASTLSSVADTAVIANGAKFNGMNALGTVAEGLKNFIALAKSQDELDALADMGMAMETLANQVSTDRFGVDDGVTGMLWRWQRLFFTANLQNRWTDAQRSAVAMGLSSNMARRAGAAFDALPLDLQRTFSQYGIDAGMWDIFRKGTFREVEGVKVMTPSAIQSIDDAELAQYLATNGQPSSPRDVKNLRFDMERKMRGYLVDQNGYMMLSPDAATMGAMMVGTRADTPFGQAWRSVMQFKSFSFAFSQRVIAREYKQHGMAGVAKMIALTTVAGYAAMTLKDAFKGKKPRDWNDSGTWLAALSQGGGMGIYGDLLTSQVFDRKQEAANALFGPTYSDLFGQQGLTGIAARAFDESERGVGDRGKDAGAAGVRFVQSNTPFINIFYTKLGLDYLVFWELQEAVNPGSLRRMEAEMEKRSGQQFIVSPADAIQ